MVFRHFKNAGSFDFKMNDPAGITPGREITGIKSVELFTFGNLNFKDLYEQMYFRHRISTL